ncbi:MAG: glycosyltransferase family 2 protein [Endozoicomonas sp.]|uniref:glycosyltransferase family 2 protein n=1 Tax=Endozoicomonas sp. TaxID=1892382 RepID=UPI003D9AD99C
MKLEALKKAYSDCFQQTPLSATYQQWIEHYETPLFGNQSALRNEASGFSYTPLISIVMPVYNVAEEYLRKAIESVQDQVYPNWQLCIADDCSTEPHIKKVLDEFQSSDSRISVKYREQNGHISKASNSALSLASGEIIALLDHDDTLAPHALFCVVKAFNENSEISFIYSDEDFIDEQGHRLRPHFKSQWNPELLRAHNYITHLAVIRKRLIDEAGGFRVGYEGAQDYDLFLRLTKHLPPDQIHHIPHILYHWRAIEGSTAADSNSKNYATEAGLKALQDQLISDRSIKVSHDQPANFYRVDSTLPEQPPLVSLIIPTRNALDVLKPCIESILEKTDYPNYEVIIVDNQSDDPEVLSWLGDISKNKKIRVIHYDAPFNYSLINNFAAKRASGEIIGLINNDVEVINSNWLCEMASLAIQQDNGCIGAKLYYPDGDIQHAGVILGLGGYAAHSHRGLPRDHPGYFNRANIRQNLSAVTGACLLVRRSIFEEVGGLNKDFTVAYNDVDFCLKVQTSGYRNVFTPFAELYHHESKTRGYDDTPEKQARFQAEKDLLFMKWGKLLENDPYYSPNLSRSHEDFSIRA